MSSPEMGGGMSDTFLDSLQRRFGIEPTPRVKLSDQFRTHNLRATAGCPCDPCGWKRVCVGECNSFKAWVDQASHRYREDKNAARRKAARLAREARG